MSKPIIRIHNIQTGEVIDREMNDDEFAELQTRQEMLVVEKAETEATATAKAALLKRLGITQDEARLLLS